MLSEFLLIQVSGFRRGRYANRQRQHSAPAVRPVGGAQVTVLRATLAGCTGSATRGESLRERAGAGSPASLFQSEQEQQGAFAQR